MPSNPVPKECETDPPGHRFYRSRSTEVATATLPAASNGPVRRAVSATLSRHSRLRELPQPAQPLQMLQPGMTDVVRMVNVQNKKYVMKQDRRQPDLIQREKELLQYAREGPSPCPVPKVYFKDSNKNATMYMEYIPGLDLLDFMTQHTMTWTIIHLILINAWEALKCLHKRGIVHADVKPENIMVSVTQNNVKVTLIDLGWACTAKRIKKYTCTPGLFGTPFYLHPDLLGGRHKPSTYSDAYGLMMSIITLACFLLQNGTAVSFTATSVVSAYEAYAEHMKKHCGKVSRSCVDGAFARLTTLFKAIHMYATTEGSKMDADERKVWIWIVDQSNKYMNAKPQK